MHLPQLRPKVIARFQSPYSGTLRVVQGWGIRHLSTDTIQQSGGIVREIWTKALNHKVQKHSSWLVLGVAGGSVLHLIFQRFAPTRIVGVDIDPLIVDIGRNYFGLDKIPHLELVIADAQKYVAKKDLSHFDYVLADLFCNADPPRFVYSPEFIRNLKRLGGQVFINHLYDTPDHIQSALHLSTLISDLGYPNKLQRVLANAVIIC